MTYPATHTTITSLTAALSLSLISCNNPADDTTDAEMNSEQAVATATANADTYHFTPNSTIKFT
ncbi:hypothetical protein OAI07_02415, partial [Akkermansiaceae bacterium]|nr:hypothetical protein [Akkermansiaceae bacterium]